MGPLPHLQAHVCPGVWGFRSCMWMPPLEGWLPHRASWGTRLIPFSGKEKVVVRSRNLNYNCNWGVGVREHLVRGGPKHTRFGHSPLTKSKGKERRGGDTGRDLLQGGPHRKDIRLTSQRWPPKYLEHSQVSVRKCGRKVGRYRPVSS